jgi:hypothetical protein
MGFAGPLEANQCSIYIFTAPENHGVQPIWTSIIHDP